MRHVRRLGTLVLLIGVLVGIGGILAQDGAGLTLQPGASIEIDVNTATGTRLDSTGFGLTCQSAGAVDFNVSGSGTHYVITPGAALTSGDTCILTVFLDGVADSDFLASLTLTITVAGESIPVTPLPATPEATSTAMADTCPDTTVGTSIGAIQGNGATFALGDTQTIRGIVTADFEDDGNDMTFDLRGFYVQDGGDGDDATSDGIFVYTGLPDSFVSVGDEVQVTGTVAEFPQTGASETQIKTDGAGILVCSTDNPLPAPVEVMLPFADTMTPERYEGMLVTFPQTLSVTELYQLGRHGELTLSSGGRLHQPTNIVLPGADAQAVMATNALNQIKIDDASLTEDPDPILFPPPELTADNTIRGGDTVTGVTGIMTQSRARSSNNGNSTIAYRVRVTTIPTFDLAPNPRPTSAPDVGATSETPTLTVASFNVLNYFNSFTITPSGCFQGGNLSASYCRGANSQLEFDRQRAKTINAVIALNADVVGLLEIENDEGDDQAIADLVDGVNAVMGAGSYAFIDTGRIGTDAIRTALIYKPATVTPVGDFATLDSLDPFNRNTRPPLAQLWQENATGEQFYVVVNHLKSKGSCPPNRTDPNADSGDGQGCWNADRLLAATEIANWIDTDAYFAADPDVLLIGDFNAYALEDPIRMLVADGYTNLVAQFIGVDAYSYAFDAQWGYLDHALANASLTPQVTGVAEFHINADEPGILDYNVEYKDDRLIDLLYSADPYRVSDHDPVVIGLDLGGE